MVGICQHCGEAHLQRNLTEFDFRYPNREFTDWESTVEALKGAEGKRLDSSAAPERTPWPLPPHP